MPSSTKNSLSACWNRISRVSDFSKSAAPWFERRNGQGIPHEEVLADFGLSPGE
jgi:hypothetical protein